MTVAARLGETNLLEERGGEFRSGESPAGKGRCVVVKKALPGNLEPGTFEGAYGVEEECVR
jgi:hypothetical protein